LIRLCALVLGFTAVVSSLAIRADAQQVGWIPRIGYLSTSSADADKSWVAAFREKLREVGHVEGENIVIEQRHAAQRSERLPALVAELVGLNVDALVVYGGAALHAAKTATSTIPIIFTVCADPVGAGYVASLARPGGNITGLSDFHAGLAAKRLELIKEVVPTVSGVAVLFNPGTPLP
jgi:putative ABC transport system substrate-binding protein